MIDLLRQGIVDSHHHIWAPASRGDEIGYGWLRDIGAMKPFGDPTPIQRDYLMAEYLNESPVPITASVHVQADPAIPDPVAETRFVASQLKATAGARGAIVAFADLTHESFETVLEAHKAAGPVVGIRQIVARLDHRPDLSFAKDDLLMNRVFRASLAMLDAQGMCFELQMYPEQAEDALLALSDAGTLPVIIDHALCPYDRSDNGIARWKRAVSLMAERDQTYMKLSGWGMYDPTWAERGAETIQLFVDHILEAFGPERTLFGSNFPVERIASPYAWMLEALLDALPKETHRDVFRQTAERIYFKDGL